MSSAMVTHYVYGSKFGLTRITDQKGMNMDYLYDSFGRLIQSKDDDGNILEHYEYNYSTGN